MSAKHTPGPWQISDHPYPHVRTVGNECVMANDWLRPEEARLIASAPDLLEALQSLVANLAGGDFISETRIDAARAAIARATGEDT